MRRFLIYTLIAVPLAAAGYGAWVWWRITTEFDQRAWNVPAQVYAAPLDLYAGRGFRANTLVEELRRLGYGPVAGEQAPGSIGAPAT